MRTVLLSREEINGICKEIGGKIDRRIRNEASVPIMIGVMKGGLNFMMDLIKEIEVPIMTDYVQISSYEGTASTGIIHLKKDLTLDVTGHTVILVDDVIDTGYSMHYLKNYIINKYHPTQIIVVALINKTSLRKIEVDIDYSGYTLSENRFLMGYGLDYKEIYRNVPYVYIPDADEIKSYDDILDKQKDPLD